MDYPRIFEEFLASHHYLCLATISPEWNPWASPLSYVSLDKQTLYFISHVRSNHSLNIVHNKKVAISIYNTEQIPGNAFWVQCCGEVEIISQEEVPDFIQEKLFNLVSLVILEREYAFYKINITEAYLPDANRWKESGWIRVSVDLTI